MQDMVGIGVSQALPRRPGERRGPYAAASHFSAGLEGFRNNKTRWLWVPAVRRDDDLRGVSQLKQFRKSVSYPAARYARVMENCSPKK